VAQRNPAAGRFDTQGLHEGTMKMLALLTMTMLSCSAMAGGVVDCHDLPSGTVINLTFRANDVEWEGVTVDMRPLRGDSLNVPSGTKVTLSAEIKGLTAEKLKGQRLAFQISEYTGPQKMERRQEI
jgi:hypothetical protein